MTAVMTDADAGTGDGSAAGKVSAARETGMAIADVLNKRGFDVCDPASKQSCYLQVTNVRASLVSLRVGRDGTVEWEYRCYRHVPHDADRLTAIVLAILNVGDDGGGPAVTDPLRPRTLKGSIGRAAADLGLRASLVVMERDEEVFEVNSEVVITDPDRPRQGVVTVTDDGEIWWRCRINDEDAGWYGLEVSEIADTLARALAVAQAS